MSHPSLEAIVLSLDGDGILHVSPHGRETVRAPWDPDLDPTEAIVDAVASLGLAPLMVHSTSWRIVRRELLLTFLIVAEPPSHLPDTFEVERVTRTELARGGPTAGPSDVHISQVVEHGLRHLACWWPRTTRSTTRSRPGRGHSGRTGPNRSARSVRSQAPEAPRHGPVNAGQDVHGHR